MAVARTFGGVPRVYEQCQGLVYLENHWFALVDLGGSDRDKNRGHQAVLAGITAGAREGTQSQPERET